VRYVIHGAGAIGATIGARLFEQGADVVLLARGPHLAALRDRGLRFGDPERTRVLQIPVAGHPCEVAWRDDEVVVLAVKGQDTPAALDDLASTASPSVAVVCAQNGVDNERQVLRRFADVYGMCVMMPATHLEPGAVDADSLPVVGVLDLGRIPSGTDERAERIARDLSASGFSSRPEPDILRWKYEKLLLNLTSGVRAACGPERDDTERDAEVRRDLEQRLQAEALACYAAAGIELPTPEERRRRYDGMLTPRPIPGRPRAAGSAWQSLARGTGSVEVDAINGEIVLLGRLHGVPTPVNALVQRVTRDLAQRGAPPGSMALGDLAAYVEAAVAAEVGAR